MNKNNKTIEGKQNIDSWKMMNLLERVRSNDASLMCLDVDESLLSNDTAVQSLCQAMSDNDTITNATFSLGDSNCHVTGDLSPQVISNLTMLCTYLSNVEQVTLHCQSRKQQDMPVECLELLLRLQKEKATRKTTLKLCLKGWKLNDACLHVITDSLEENVTLSKLTLSNCRCKADLAITVVGNQGQDTTLMGAQLALALGANTKLEALTIDNTRLPLSWFQSLPCALSKNTSLKELDINTYLHGSEMTLLLDAIHQSCSLNQISLPVLLDKWTSALQHQLQLTLTNGDFIKIHIRFLPMPAGGCFAFMSPQTSPRNQVWKIFKSYLSSNSTLQELRVSNLTEIELLGLADVVVSMQHKPTASLEQVCLLGAGVSIPAVAKMVNLFSSCNTSSLRVNIQFTLYNGEEYHADAVTALSSALIRNYVVEELSLICSEYSAIAPNKSLTEVHPKQGNTMASIVALNQAGRRYLLQDPSNIDLGVSVLHQVSQDVNGIFHHLQEHPSLCHAAPRQPPCLVCCSACIDSEALRQTVCSCA